MNFHYDDSFNHIMSGKAANHCLLKNTHILHAENEACASGFLSLRSYTEKKNCHFFLFQKLRKLKGKGIWTLSAPPPPLLPKQYLSQYRALGCDEQKECLQHFWFHYRSSVAMETGL